MRAVNCPSFRKMCADHGAGVVSTQAFWAWERELWQGRLEQEFLLKEKNLSVQVGGNAPEDLRAAVELLEPFAAVMDINAGCAENEVLGKKSGAFLLLHLDQLARVISTVTDATDLPVTVKVRTGWDEPNMREIIRTIDDFDVAAITVHGRTRKQRYARKADWEQIRTAEDSTDIPIIGNGDVLTPEGARQMQAQTGCDAVMVGRAAKGDPFVFRQINAFLESKQKVYQDDQGRIADFLRFAESYHGVEEDRSSTEFRDHAIWWLKGMKGVAGIRKRIASSGSIAEIEHCMQSLIR